MQPFGIVEVRKPPRRDIDEWLTFDLPAPPSVNSIIGSRLGNSHPKVQRWRKHADAHLVFTKQNRKLGKPIIGDFAIEILIDRSIRTRKRGDLDNRIKVLLDYCEYLRIVDNDGNCSRITAGWDDVPDGCRVRLRPWEWMKGEQT